MSRNIAGSALDPRRAAAATRLRRLKRAIIGITAVMALGIWSSVSATASLESSVGTSPAPAPAAVTAPADRSLFGDGAPQLGSSNDRAPVLRSQGS